MMTFEEFQKTARIVLEADEERIEYPDGAGRIDLVVGGGLGNPAEGMFCLTIENYSEQGFDLYKFEAELYAWAKTSVLF